MTSMEYARIDISQDLDGLPVVHACFDLTGPEIAACGRAVAASAAERFRMSELSADEVLELRELTAVTDDLGELTGGTGTVVLKPARLSILRDAASRFVQTRDESEWLREEDREALAVLREMIGPLEALCGEATRAALAPEQRSHS
jgi:hypothetical protein